MLEIVGNTAHYAPCCIICGHYYLRCKCDYERTTMKEIPEVFGPNNQNPLTHGSVVFGTKPKEGETITNEQGAKQSFIAADYECIPPVVLRLLAQCLGFGRRKYGFENWKGIPFEDNLNHAMNHIVEWRMGDRSEPHLVNAMARLTFALTQAVESQQQPPHYIRNDE